MTLNGIMSSLRVELQDTNQALYSEDELIRAIDKSVNLMSRLIPKRSIVETTIVRVITNETLTITDSIGTLAYKPIKKGTVAVTGKTLNTDYRVNYISGAITEIGSNLLDNDYLVSYELDSSMLDLSSILTDYIKLERVEYPAGNSPATLLTFDTYGSIIVFRGTVTLTEDEHLRVIYLTKWTSPTPEEEGNYPSHLDDAIIIGSSGQALIYKAEHYTQQAADALATLVAPTAYTIIKPTSPTLPIAPTSPTFDALTAPTDYTFSKPTAPTLPDAPTAPTPPSLEFTAAEAAMSAVATEITAAKTKLTFGETLINTATRGENVAATYGSYGGVVMGGAGHRASESIARLRQVEDILAKYASEVTTFGSEVNAYANEISGTIGKYRGEVEAEVAGANIFSAAVGRYIAEIEEQNLKIGKYRDEVNQYAAQTNALITKYRTEIDCEVANINNFTSAINKYSAQAAEQDMKARNFLDIAGRYLASGQAKINEFLISLGVKTEISYQKASSEQRS